MTPSRTRVTRAVAMLVAVGSIGVGASASAAPARTLLLESHVLPPTPAERQLLHRVATALGDRVEWGAALGQRIAKALGQRPRLLSTARRTALLDAIKDASQSAYLGTWPRAIRLLRWVRRELRAHALTLAKQRPVFRALQKARILLAMCYVRTGRRAEAWAIMEETLRAEPGLSLSLPIHGPALQQLYFRVKSQLDLKRGQLNVLTEPPGALIFLDGRSVGFSPVELPNLYTGRYDLIVVHGAKVSRLRRVRITTAVTRVSMNLHAEDALQTRGQAAIALPAGPHRTSRELRLASSLGHRLGASRVLLVGIQPRRHRRALVGRVLRVSDRKTLAMAYVALEPGPVPQEAPGRLARFLLDGKNPGRGVVVGTGRRALAPGTLPPRHRTPRRDRAGAASGLVPAGWTLVVTGIAVAVGGGIALALDGVTAVEPTATRQREVYRTGRIGYGMLGGGLGLAALGAVLLIADTVRARATSGSARRGFQWRGGVAKGGGWLGIQGAF